LMRKIIKGRIENHVQFKLEERLIEAIKQSINDLESKDPSLLSTLISLPGFSEIESLCEKVNPILINKECIDFQVSIGLELIKDFRRLTDKVLLNVDQRWPNGKGERQLLSKTWFYLALVGDSQIIRNCVDSIANSSMTMARSALGALKLLDSPETEEASNLFYDLWKENPVVLDSWFAYEASRPQKKGIDVIEKLLSHSKFDWKAPNAIRAVIGGFSKNIESFHSLDGQGYLFMAEKIIEVDKINPITASRLVKTFSKWRTYIEENKEQMYKSILKINQANISSNTREVVELILKRF